MLFHSTRRKIWGRYLAEVEVFPVHCYNAPVPAWMARRRTFPEWVKQASLCTMRSTRSGLHHRAHRSGAVMWQTLENWRSYRPYISHLQSPQLSTAERSVEDHVVWPPVSRQSSLRPYWTASPTARDSASDSASAIKGASISKSMTGCWTNYTS